MRYNIDYCLLFQKMLINPDITSQPKQETKSNNSVTLVNVNVSVNGSSSDSVETLLNQKTNADNDELGTIQQFNGAARDNSNLNKTATELQSILTDINLNIQKVQFYEFKNYNVFKYYKSISPDYVIII